MNFWFLRANLPFILTIAISSIYTMTKLYGRSKFRKAIQKRVGERKLSPNVDLLMYLNYVIFMEKLAKEARKNTLERNSKMMNNTDIANCLEDVLREFRG